jgi:hypothetical protein
VQYIQVKGKRKETKGREAKTFANPKETLRVEAKKTSQNESNS